MKQVIFSLAIGVALTVLLELGSAQNLCASEGFPGATVVDRDCTEPTQRCTTICQAAGGTCESSVYLFDLGVNTVVVHTLCIRNTCNGREVCCCSINNNEGNGSSSGSDSR